MELSSIGDQVFAVESITNKRVRKVRMSTYLTEKLNRLCLFSLLKERSAPVAMHKQNLATHFCRSQMPSPAFTLRHNTDLFSCNCAKL